MRTTELVADEQLQHVNYWAVLQVIVSREGLSRSSLAMLSVEC